MSVFIESLTNGRGADVAFEVIGNPHVVRDAVLSVAPGGRAVLAGLASPSVNLALPLTHIVRRKIQIHGIMNLLITNQLLQSFHVVEYIYFQCIFCWW